MKIAIFFILIVTGAVALSATEDSSNHIVKESNLRGSVSIIERAFQEQLEEKRHEMVKFVTDNEYSVEKAEEATDLIFEPQSLSVIRTCICNGITYALCCDGRCSSPNHRRCLASVELMKDEKEDMTHQVSSELVTDDKNSVQKTEVEKAEEATDLIFEPQGAEELPSYCPCNSDNVTCCFGVCTDYWSSVGYRCRASVELMKDEEEDMTHDVPAEIAYPFVCHCTSDNVLCCFRSCNSYGDDSRCLERVKLMKDEEEDMTHQVSSELVTDDKDSVQKTEVEKDLDFEPQGTEEFVSIYCYCNSNNALCCLGSCGGPNGICSARGYPRVELMKDEEEDMTHDVPAEIAYPEFVEEETTCLLNGASCYMDIFRSEVQKCCSGYCKSYAGGYVGVCRDSDIE